MDEAVPTVLFPATVNGEAAGLRVIIHPRLSQVTIQTLRVGLTT
jgi:hypothetical protein